MKKISRNNGFIKIIFLAVIIIATLAYFNIDLRVLFENPVVQKITDILATLWIGFIKPSIMYIINYASEVFGK